MKNELRTKKLTRSEGHSLSRIDRRKEKRLECILRIIVDFTGTLLQRLLVAIIIAVLTALLL